MNAKAAGNKAQEVVESITNSSWWQKIKPTINELNNTTAGFRTGENVQDKVKGVLEALEVENADKLSKKVHMGSYEKDIDNLKDSISGYTDNVDNAISIMKNQAKSAIDAGVDPNSLDLNILEKAINYPKAYFMNPDKNIRNTRIKTAVGAYAGITVGGRYLSGGTLATDSYGQKDIAGVPFL